MARQVLDNGVILPSEFSDDWYEDMTTNLTKLDEVIGSDAEKLDETDVGEAAISNDYDDLDNKPDYNVLRRAAVTLTAGGTGNYSDLDSDSKIKAGDYVLDADNKLYSITAIDAANSTYTVSAAALFTVTDKAELGAAALSNSYDDLSNLPGYGILRFCSTAITDNSSVPFANISSVSKIAAGDFLLDTAAKLYTVSAVDTVNQAVSVTTPLTQLAVDSSVVHNTGNEDVNGIKTFKDMIPIDGDYLGNEASTNQRTNICLRSNRDTADKSGAYITRFRQNRSQGALQTGDLQMIGFDVLENKVRTNNVLSIQCTGWLDDVPQKVDIVSGAQSYSYGNSARKALFNDLNPGALSLPDLNNGVDISGSLDVSRSSINTYIPPSDGYISILGRGSVTNGIVIKTGSLIASMGQSVLDFDSTDRVSFCLCPVLKNKTVTIWLKSVTSLDSAKFFPCQGNV
jgi:hypothetical protein